MNDMPKIPFDCFSFIQTVKEKGVILSSKDNSINIWGPKSVIDEQLAATLRENKFEVIEFLASHQAGKKHDFTIIPDAQAKYDEFELTEIQRAYWVGRQKAFDFGDVSIHFYTEVDCENLDVERLSQAWNKTVAYHDMLRAVVDQKGMQRIQQTVPFYQIEAIDLRRQGAHDTNQTLQTIRDDLSQKVHSTEVWPAFDLKVVHLDATHSKLFFGQDLLHIDGGSLLIILKDFATWYLEPEFQKPACEISFRDYAIADANIKSTERYANDLTYWNAQLQEMAPPPQLPSRDAQGERPAFRRRLFSLNQSEFQTLNTQAARLGISPTGFVMSAFADIISCWNGGEDYALNVTLFNRPNIHEDLARIAGDFTSMVLVPVQKIGNEPVIDRARRLQRTLWNHLDHTTVSGITLLDNLRKLRGNHDAGTYTIVFTSLLNLSENGFSSDWLSAIGTHSYTVTQTPQVTIDHQIFEQSDGGLAFSWDVIENLFPDGLIDSMFAAYEAFVKVLLHSNEAWHNPSPCHTRAQDLALFAAANDTAVHYPKDETLRTLFERAVATHPENIAVCDNFLAITYRDLGSLADRLATNLSANNIAHEDKVIVFMDKGWAQVVAVLGIHAAGAAYVPVDIGSPQKRIAHIAHDCNAKAVLLDPNSAQLWPEDLNLPQIIVSADLLATENTNQISPAAPRTKTLPQHASHVIYTSGSTGQPKGVVIEHRNVANRIYDINSRFEVNSNDAILGLTALHHDLSVYDIFGVLAAGGALVLPDAEKRLDPSHWVHLMEKRRVTLWNSVPAFAGILTDYLAENQSAALAIPLRWMILAGDWIPVSLPSKVKQHWPSLDFIASGGPTETTIWDIWNRVETADPQWKSIPYGKPLANAQYFVLDKALQPCPVWVAGELYIAGAGVTREYLNAPDITAAKYIDHPSFGLRLFKSGDMGRYLPDGQIEFLGRNDFQVKIHGQRIELAEIEKVALQEGQLENCVALVKTTQNGPALVLFTCAKAAHAAPIGQDLAAQQQEFAALNVGITDPVQRLVHKLEYRALVPHADASGIALPLATFKAQPTKSHRHFRQQPMLLSDLSRFLEPISGTRQSADGEAKFHYGSGGGVYPVQVYIAVKQGAFTDLEGGIYRFHPLHRSLSLISKANLPESAHWSYNRTLANAAPLQLFVCADLEVMRAHYGPMAEGMCYLEAGMLAQVLRQAAHETGFGTCQLGFVDPLVTTDLLKLEPSQKLLTALVAGQIPANADEKTGEIFDPAQLRTKLEAFLPAHMVPQHIVNLPSLPLTSNGKVDRKKLLEMDFTNVEIARTHVAPQDGFEHIAATILSEIIGIEKIGVTENFFDLGANSALLVRAYNKILNQTGLDFPLISLFRFPTIRSLHESLNAQPVIPTEDTRAAKLKASLANVRGSRSR